MLNEMIVLVSDIDDASHGEINVLDGPVEAARFVEALLEAGLEQERVRVFGGDELQMQIHQRPVVSLITNGGGWQEKAQADQAAAGQAVEASPEQEQLAASEIKTDRVTKPFERNGERFSSQFRPA